MGLGRVVGSFQISIHALLAESDWDLTGGLSCDAYFYPRSPCGERRWVEGDSFFYYAFLSTLSLRRATYYIAIRPTFYDTISIHALLAESDIEHAYQLVLWVLRFLSTLSLRRATRGTSSSGAEAAISIHALLAESDCYSFRHSASCWHFYPRSPCGERHSVSAPNRPKEQFLSTLSLRRATIARNFKHPEPARFLSTLSLRRATGLIFFDVSLFLSTLSLRRATR